MPYHSFEVHLLIRLAVIYSYSIMFVSNLHFFNCIVGIEAVFLGMFRLPAIDLCLGISRLKSLLTRLGISISQFTKFISLSPYQSQKLRTTGSLIIGKSKSLSNR